MQVEFLKDFLIGRFEIEEGRQIDIHKKKAEELIKEEVVKPCEV